MSMKRYDLDGNADGYFDDPFMKLREDGKFVLHSDYTALLTRHNALVEAVKKLSGASRDYSEFVEESFECGSSRLDAARAEVDRLIGEADCKGEGK